MGEAYPSSNSALDPQNGLASISSLSLSLLFRFPLSAVTGITTPIPASHTAALGHEVSATTYMSDVTPFRSRSTYVTSSHILLRQMGPCPNTIPYSCQPQLPPMHGPVGSHHVDCAQPTPCYPQITHMHNTLPHSIRITSPL